MAQLWPWISGQPVARYSGTWYQFKGMDQGFHLTYCAQKSSHKRMRYWAKTEKKTVENVKNGQKWAKICQTPQLWHWISGEPVSRLACVWCQQKRLDQGFHFKFCAQKSSQGFLRKSTKTEKLEKIPVKLVQTAITLAFVVAFGWSKWFLKGDSKTF